MLPPLAQGQQPALVNRQSSFVAQLTTLRSFYPIGESAGIGCSVDIGRLTVQNTQNRLLNIIKVFSVKKHFMITFLPGIFYISEFYYRNYNNTKIVMPV